jgi:hypothetical protein
MNERIGTLLNRSGGEFYEGFLGSPNTIKFTEEELNTFAKLIVRECLAQIRGVSNGYLDYRDQIEDGMRDACIDTIKHHFRVEE